MYICLIGVVHRLVFTEGCCKKLSLVKYDGHVMVFEAVEARFETWAEPSENVVGSVKYGSAYFCVGDVMLLKSQSQRSLEGAMIQD